MRTDAELQRDVLQALESEPIVEATHVDVSVENGMVILRGRAPNFAQKVAAEDAAKRVQGVRLVVNEIEVSWQDVNWPKDEDLARAAINALQANSLVPKDRIKVTVRDGWITLEGTVDWHYQKEAAARAVRNLEGVKGIVNFITLAPSRAEPAQIKATIQQGLERTAGPDARDVGVEVHDSKVILSGSVSSWPQAENAERVAWSAPGVAEVENRLEIAP